MPLLDPPHLPGQLVVVGQAAVEQAAEGRGLLALARGRQAVGGGQDNAGFGRAKEKKVTLHSRRGFFNDRSGWAYLRQKECAVRTSKLN